VSRSGSVHAELREFWLGPRTRARLRWYGPSGPVRGAMLLLPGAGSGSEHPVLQVLGERFVASGWGVGHLEYPYQVLGRRWPPDPMSVLLAAVREAVGCALLRSVPALWGGRSLGARLALRAAAEGAGSPLGVFALGYPLYRPGRRSQMRRQELLAYRGPLFIAQGERDPFGSPEELRAVLAGRPNWRLCSVAGADHELRTGSWAWIAELEQWAEERLGGLP